MLWVVFNKEGQWIAQYNVGNTPVAGTNEFQIFAYFKNINNAYNGASLKLYKPDLNNDSYVPLLMNKTSAKYEGTTNDNLTNNETYNGFLFDFSQVGVPSLLDTAGVWRAVITLYAAYSSDVRNVVGTVTFEVGNGIDSSHGTEIPDEEVITEIYAALAAKLDTNSNKYVKHIDNISNLNEPSNQGYIESGDVVFTSDTNEVYSISGSYPNLTANLMEHGIVLPNVDLSNYQLSDEQYENLNHNDSFIVYQNNIYKKTKTDSTDEYRVNKITYVGNDTYNITSYYILVYRQAKVIVSYGTHNDNFYTTDKVDSLLETIRGNEFTLVDTIQYPTLESFLLSTGMEGIIYLYPVGDNQNNYYKYIWENSRWISLGTTQFDLSQYYNKTETDNLLAAKEDVENKTTTLSALSTDTQYPSAKAVYDNLQDIRETAEGKCKTFVLSDSDTIQIVAEELAENPLYKMYLVNSTNGFDNPIDITQDVIDGEYDDASIVNNIFASNNDVISNDESSDFLIVRGASVVGDSQYLITYLVQMSRTIFSYGDIFLVVEVDVPDRWYAGFETGTSYLYKLETSKVDLNNVYKKNESLIPADIGYSVGNRTKYFSYVYCDYINANKIRSLSDSGNVLEFTSSGIIANRHIVPSTTNSYDVGSSSYKWKDLYLSGKAYFVGTNETYFITQGSSGFSIGIGASNVKFALNSTDVKFDTNVIPFSNNAKNIGSSTYTWKDLYLSGKAYIGNTSTGVCDLIDFVNSSSYTYTLKRNGNYLELQSNGTTTFRINDDVVYSKNFRPNANNTYNLGNSSFYWKDLYLTGSLYGASYNFTIDSAFKILYNRTYNDNARTVIDYEVMYTMSVSTNTTFTLSTAPNSCYPEYKAQITNSSSSAINLTFTGVTSILTNDDEDVVINGNVITLSAGVTIECSIVNGKMVAVVF